MKRELIIAIDGPSGSGKSTLSRLLAAALNYINIDTGAMYRSVGLAAHQAGVDPEDAQALAELCERITIEFVRSGTAERVLLNGADVSEAIRTPEMSMMASRVSACPAVREAMGRLQKAMGEQGGVVLEGRDIGTVVFPQAEVKFFLLASAAERGRRRFEELRAKGLQVDLQQTIDEVEQRDAADSNRQHAPLVQADDALAIDTTTMTIDQVLQEMLEIVTKRRLQGGEAQEGENRMMKIILADSAGFCFGVKRATQLAFKAAEENCPICSLGPIIHSPQVVEKLEKKGVKVVQKVEDITEGTVIIRSHGITAGELADIHARNLTPVDATCPFVKKVQDYATLLCAEGYAVVLVGEKDHPEVQGIISYTGHTEVAVVVNSEEARHLPDQPKIGIVAQTTQSIENLRQVADVCLQKSKEVRVFNTICDATSVRQGEAREIAQQADLMLVVGGFNSANTTRLAQICRELQPRTYHVEIAEQIESEWFAGVKMVGITAGASTPRWIIDEVVKRVGSFEN